MQSFPIRTKSGSAATVIWIATLHDCVNPCLRAARYAKLLQQAQLQQSQNLELKLKGIVFSPRVQARFRAHAATETPQLFLLKDQSRFPTQCRADL